VERVQDREKFDALLAAPLAGQKPPAPFTPEQEASSFEAFFSQVKAG
jgi:hypothetical protein